LIRECNAEQIRSIRINKNEQVQKQLDDIQLGKVKKDVRRDIYTVCSDLIDTAFHGEGGKQLWVGILPGSVVCDLTMKLPREEYSSGKM